MHHFKVHYSNSRVPLVIPALAILNTFCCSAYNLEVLEAQFYTCATTGKPIPSNLLNGGGQPSGESDLRFMVLLWH